ncbi:hypothetical protein BKA62DRAFT_721977 [Auriculariales sp. MPI-PUGE-AT-0066]|nr:hypothetical protein BKA62DRAFT_721977 [Auriculariales sp. MPI-PUGE-AT-0066]
MHLFLLSPAPLIVTVENKASLDDLFVFLAACPGVAAGVNSVNILAEIDDSSQDTMELKLFQLITLCPNVLSVIYENIGGEELALLLGHLPGTLDSLTDRPFWSHINDLARARPHFYLLFGTTAERALEIEYISRSLSTAQNPPLIICRVHDTEGQSFLGPLMTSSSAVELRSVTFSSWFLERTETDKLWASLSGHAPVDGNQPTTKAHDIVTLDLRDVPAVTFTGALASLIQLCPRLRHLGVGARPLQHDVETDPETEVGLEANLVAAPRALRILLVNCYGFPHAETMTGLIPFLERIITAGALRHLRKLILESGSRVHTTQLPRSTAAPDILRNRRISFVSRIANMPRLPIA